MMAQIELTESDNELLGKLAAILRKGTKHPDYFTLDGLQSEVWPVSRRLFDILEAAITERIPGVKLDRTEPRRSPVKKGRQVLDSLSVTLINIDPTLYSLHLGVSIGMDDREEELSHKLTWGVSTWGGDEWIEEIRRIVEMLDLKAENERIMVFKSPLFGGSTFHLGNDLSPDELEHQPLAQLVDQIVNDFDVLFRRFKSREKEIIDILAPPEPPESGTMRYWKISPGKRAEYWNEFKELSCIAIGWEETGDLREFNSQEAIKDFVTRNKLGWKLPYTSKQLWWISHEMKAGDKVFAYGSKKILGVGEILGGYDFRQDDVMPYFAHRRPVRWTHLESKPIGNLPNELQGKLTRTETIIRLSEREGQRIMALYDPSINPPGPNGPQDGPDLSRYFAAHSLHFTPHQLATFYIALKTKGFVILTGISGTGKTKLAQYFAELLGSKDQFHFAAVRPDWRDSKSLLGYFNPLLGKEGRFQSTEFLQFLLLADDNYRSSLHELEWEADDPYASTLIAGQPNAFSTDTVRLSLKAVNASGQVVAEGTFEFKVNERRQLALPGQLDDLQPFRNAAKIYALELDRVSPYFILFDEMNLAKVEYYFADLLSVLESGRQPDGFTKEAIRFQYPEGVDGPPRQLYLPPNLYFIGTVNVDETTYMFSPKVLDRAFTLELSTVEFPEYINSTTESEFELPPDEQQRLLDDFTRGGKFATIGKDEKRQIKALAKQPDGKYTTYAGHLTTLNTLLQPHDLHFGYRVFDEIIMFLTNAEGSPVFDGFNSSLDAAFDATVLMKVLPKFHGTRGKLRESLEKTIWWAREPGNPETGGLAVSEKLQNAEGIASLREGLSKCIGGESSDADAFTYPRTALKALRMLHDLYTTGFASFA